MTLFATRITYSGPRERTEWPASTPRTPYGAVAPSPGDTRRQWRWRVRRGQQPVVRQVVRRLELDGTGAPRSPLRRLQGLLYFSLAFSDAT